MVPGSYVRWCMALCIVAAMSGAAYPQETACNEDYEKFCKGLKPGGGRVLTCLLKNTDKLKPECRELLSQLTASKGRKVSMTLMPSPKEEKLMPVPEEYRKMYTALQSALADFDARLNSAVRKEPGSAVFGAGLPPADSSRGRALLGPGAIEAVIGYLDQLKEIGVQGVTVPIGYPLYTPAFPGYGEYVSFYKEVAREVKKRDMKLCVESHVVFANTGYRDLRVTYTGLTFDRYKAEKKGMISAIINDLAPDYLDIGSEPDTESALTGLAELNDPLKYTEYVRYVLTGLNRGKSRIAAGMGSWGSLAFATSLARSTSVDALAVHVYPVTGRAADNLLAVADIARQHGKGIVIDEVWLTKSDQHVSRAGSGSAEVLRRDSFSFWSPLDQRFIGIMAKFARAKGVEYMSPMRSDCLFAYVDYDEKIGRFPYRDIQSMQESAAMANAGQGKLTRTGRYYWILIESASR